MSSGSPAKRLVSPPLVSVITTAIPERLDLLEECKLSVESQTFENHEHLVGLDEDRRGAAWIVNQLAEQARGLWLLPLADDDLLLPGAIQTLLARSELADVVYSPPLIRYPASWHFFQDPPLLPATALIWKSLFLKLGGYEQGINREEDRSFWVKAVESGARFVKVEEPVWVYRLHLETSDHQNKSYHQGEAR